MPVPRSTRPHVPRGCYHVTRRGNGDEPVFLDDNDRTWFLTLFTRVVRKESWQCFAYCLMTNHYHVVLRVSDGSLSRGLQWVNGLYAQAFNNRHNRRGHVFGGRYTLTSVGTEEHLAEACRYVVCNPIRAGLCDHPGDWAWSSYRAAAGIERGPGCLALSAINDVFGSPSGFAAYVDDVLPTQKGSGPVGV